jgi:hypothetical protein
MAFPPNYTSPVDAWKAPAMLAVAKARGTLHDALLALPPVEADADDPILASARAKLVELLAFTGATYDTLIPIDA